MMIQTLELYNYPELPSQSPYVFVDEAAERDWTYWCAHDDRFTFENYRDFVILPNNRWQSLGSHWELKIDVRKAN
jgi:hypothetical protein